MKENTSYMHESSTYMEVFNNGKEIGFQEGRKISLRFMLSSWSQQIKAVIPKNIQAQIRSLSMNELTALADDWNKIATLIELQNWLASSSS